MGFRNIEAFNQALLAKQAWIILKTPDSLFSQFMKNKYFANSDFLSASLSSRPSYVWRSILHGRDLLTKGLYKLVGNGLSLHVWTDPWIRDGQMLRPLIKNPVIDIDLRVSDLIDYERRDWIKDKLEDLFYPEDVKCILKSKR